MTNAKAVRRERERQELLAAVQKVENSSHRRRHILTLAAWGVGLVLVVVAVTAGLLSARSEQNVDTRVAPDFTLVSSDGTSTTLSSLRGSPVILYFNEGAGCDSCLVQMGQIEKDPGFAEAGITVLPIVMNTADQINIERNRLGVSTPFLLDDGTVSEAYDVLGTGMHEGLPGHGFILIDVDGTQLWSGSYPSMWLDPAELLTKSKDLLAG
mgnify:CR=1 FL=1